MFTTALAIRQNLVSLLEKKMVTKITIKEIVEGCHINRNTFYYNYNDIYDVVRDLFKIQLEKVIQTYQETGSWEEAILKATSLAKKHKTIVYNIYNTDHKPIVEQYLYEAAKDIMTRFIAICNKEIKATKESCSVIVDFYTGALLQLVLEWLNDNMEKNPEELVRSIGKFFKGSVENSLRNSLTK